MASLRRAIARACSVGAAGIYVALTQESAVVCAGKPQSDSSRTAFEQCPEVACKSSEELAAMFGERVSRRPLALSQGAEDKRSGNAGAAAALAFGGAAQAAGSKQGSDLSNCPPNREQLGRSTWTFLHAVAAYYPDLPTAEEQSAADGLIQTLARLYPCKHCRAAFVGDIAEHPPTLSSRRDFVVWLCGAHNRVNDALGKPRFACTLQALDERWRTGRAECWGGKAAAEQTAGESLGQAADDEGDGSA